MCYIYICMYVYIYIYIYILYVLYIIYIPYIYKDKFNSPKSLSQNQSQMET